MKKVLVSLMIAALFTMAFASCKTHERCPAYGKKVNHHDTTKPV